MDLSRTYRLSGLTSGAKLELVLLSRSPSVVSVALQLPESEAKDIPNGRLTDKFPSTTTLWLILRKFESGGGGGGAHARNFTARGIAQTNNGETGAGRLYYETPVLQAMGRELSSFTDLQKTLGQLGFNSGSILLRLSFRATQRPLEEAMTEIDQYFKAIESDETSARAHAGSVGAFESRPETEETILPDDIAGLKTPPEPPEASSSTDPTTNAATTEPTTDSSNGEKRKAASPATSPSPPPPPQQQPPSSESLPTDPSHRPITIYLPPTTSTPSAAQRPHNPTDYEPTLDHARQHQTRLSSTARNRRLPSDTELAALRAAQAEKLAAVSAVEIKIRFPDQTTVVATFGAQDTAADLYAFVRGLLEDDGEECGFELRFFEEGRGRLRVVPSEGRERLIGDLGMRGRVLITVAWGDGGGKSLKLKREVRERAREMVVEDVGGGVEVGEGSAGGGGAGMEKEAAGGKGGGSGRKGGVPKWLKLPGKK